jgi:CheY-like chemotaxis protein
VTLVVADNGPGMSAEQQQGLFKPFDRLGAERTGVEGSGLGLVITRQLVDAMGGTMWVDSVSGQGTTVSVTLPRIPAPAAVPAATSDPGSPAGTAAGVHANRRVLFIGHAQDDRDLIEAAVRTLPNASLTASHDGRSGIRTARILRADLVIIGLDPSDMSGADVLRALRAQPQTRDVRCVALSADAAAGAASDVRAAGFQESWPKPLGRDFLRSRLLALLA